MARLLRDSGLQWVPELHDEFVIPDRDLDDRVYVLSELHSSVQSLHGQPAVSFHGSLEWALDSLITSEVIWLPSEGQLRQEILKRLRDQSGSSRVTSWDETETSLVLRAASHLSICELFIDGQWVKFEAPSTPEAYGNALLYLLTD